MKRSLLLGAALLLVACDGNVRAPAAKDETVRDGGAIAEEIDVQIVPHNGGFRLLRGGQPYQVRGAGIDAGELASLAAHGGNSFRTWSTSSSTPALLDEAARRDLTVILCLAIGRERQGFDYDDEQAVASQLAFAREEVTKYRNHPALLAWMIGNEPNLNFTNPRVFDAINDISKMIHEVDGRHPTTVALASFNAELAALIESRAPDLDFVSIQMYGELVHLPDVIARSGYSGPFMVTEWGAIGHWEMPRTAWGAPIEQNSSEKAANYLNGWHNGLEPVAARLLGNYVFLWGQKQERTPTWFGMFLADGSETESVDVVHRLWNGSWPDNRAPRIDSLTIDSRTSFQDVRLRPGDAYDAIVFASDPDGESLRYRWEIMRESAATQEGGDPEEVPATLPGLPANGDAHAVRFTAPAPGAYRLFVYVYDGHGNAGHANVPFLVE